MPVRRKPTKSDGRFYGIESTLGLPQLSRSTYKVALEILLALLVISYGIIAAFLPQAVLLEMENSKQVNYFQSLVLEIQNNLSQSKDIQEKIKNNKSPLILISTYSNEAYKSGLSNGYLEMIKGDASQKLSYYYSRLPLSNHRLERIEAEPDNQRLKRVVLGDAVTQEMLIEELLPTLKNIEVSSFDYISDFTDQVQFALTMQAILIPGVLIATAGYIRAKKR